MLYKETLVNVENHFFQHFFFSIETLSGGWRKTLILPAVCYPPVKSWQIKECK